MQGRGESGRSDVRGGEGEGLKEKKKLWGSRMNMGKGKMRGERCRKVEGRKVEVAKGEE